MHDITLFVNAAHNSIAWIRAMVIDERGAQIEKLVSSSLKLRYTGGGKVTPSELTEFMIKQISISFDCSDLNLASQEFQRIAPLINLPPGASLSAFTITDDGQMLRTKLVQW